MKVKNLTYGKSWELQGYWEKVLIEVEVEENELPNTVLDKAKNIVEGWHRQRNPELYVDVIDENKKVPIDEIIQERKDVDIVSEINSCTDLKILESYKFIARSQPCYQEAYDKKLKQLK